MYLTPKKDSVINYQGMFIVVNRAQIYEIKCYINYTDQINDYYLVVPHDTEMLFACSMTFNELVSLFDVWDNAGNEVTSSKVVRQLLNRLPVVSTKGELKQYIRQIK